MGILDLLKKSGGEENHHQNDAPLSLPDVIAPSAINVSPRHLNISGKLARIFFAVSYPRYLSDGWLEPILNLERETDVTIIIHPIDTSETLKIPKKGS
jgi:hypothetical protein